ncbi:WD-40 repeat-containing protein MSI4-like [Forsythia ovata]|uniref:WD-40 repeat-containing protein MSI4-like n=1 Tax=Forsythia ovata TaxID=205694 RepID=A0ABD1TUE3_9LAMI
MQSEQLKPEGRTQEALSAAAEVKTDFSIKIREPVKSPGSKGGSVNIKPSDRSHCSSSRSVDNTVRMYDRRNLTSGGVGSPIHIFEGHSAAVLCVQWSPDRSSVFGSAAEDGILNIWDYGKVWIHRLFLKKEWSFEASDKLDWQAGGCWNREFKFSPGPIHLTCWAQG